MSTRQRFPVFGVILLLVGIALLLERLEILAFGWGRILWTAITLLGAGVVIRAFLENSRGKVFWGTVLFLFGLLFLLRSFRLVENQGELFLPAALTILGLAFFMLFVADPRDWHLLIPSAVLLAFGGTFMLTEVGYFHRWEVWETVGRWWPLVLILVGILLLVRRRKV
jgi:hypothetical protein